MWSGLMARFSEAASAFFMFMYPSVRNAGPVSHDRNASNAAADFTTQSAPRTPRARTA
jgi:hypothetical protein